MEYTKVEFINTIYNFIVDNFFHLESIRLLNIHFIFLDFKIQNLGISNDYELQHFLYHIHLKILNLNLKI